MTGEKCELHISGGNLLGMAGFGAVIYAGHNGVSVESEYLSPEDAASEAQVRFRNKRAEAGIFLSDPYHSPAWLAHQSANIEVLRIRRC